MTTVRTSRSLEHTHAALRVPFELSLRWSVSRPALEAAVRGVALPAQPEITVALNAVLGPKGEVRDVRAVAAGSPLAQDLTSAAAGLWLCDEETSLLHVRVTEPSSDTPLLDATLKLTDGEPELLYARTTLLSHLKLPGGRYEVDRAAIAPLG